MKKLLLIVILCLVNKVQAQVPPDSVYQHYYKILDDGREGKGNGTFSINIQFLQSFLLKRHKVTDFEKCLAQWGRLSGKNGEPIEVTFEWDDSTHQHDIPRFEVCYSNVTAKKTDFIRIVYGLDNVVKSFQFDIWEDKIDVNKARDYIHQLVKAGYTEDIAMNRLNTSFTGGNSSSFFLKNKSVHIFIEIRPIQDDRTIFIVTKSS